MGAKRNFYKQHVHRRIYTKKLIYLAAVLLCLGIIIYDSFVNGCRFTMCFSLSSAAW